MPSISPKLVLLITLYIFLAGKNHAQNGSCRLRCEHLFSPGGIDARHPRLSWQINDKRQDAGQSAFQILVDTDSLKLENAITGSWNSGKIKSSQQMAQYAGPALLPFTKYYWKVKIWDKADKLLPASPVGVFETSLLTASNWKGSWISDNGNIQTPAAPYFRKKISLAKKVKEARAYIAAAGLFELYINGERAGDHRLDPMYTRFDRRNLYVSHDITRQLVNGNNVIGVILGNGWYNHQSLAVWNFDRAPWRQRPAFCIDIRVNYTDGTTETFSSDRSWKTKTGPIIFNSIYTGEHYDSRLELGEWLTPDYKDNSWQTVQLRSAPSNNIVSQSMEPIRNVETIKPVSLKRISDTCYVFDIGRNIAGVVKIKLQGDSGTVVKLVHGERLYQDTKGKLSGHVDQSNIDVYLKPKVSTDPFQTDIIILNGKQELEFMPRFNYKGFRYVEVKSSAPIQLDKESLTAFFMHSDVNKTGNLQSSNPLIEKMWNAANNSYLSNLFGYPTDCPQREKNGWTGDAHFAIESALYNFDGITVYEKWLADHRDEQQPNGVLPDIIPTGGWGYGTANGTDWTSTIVLIPWNLYLFYGDKKPLEDNYTNMKAYVNYVENISNNGLTSFGRGDWVPVKSRSSLELTSSIYFYADADILSKTAALLGKQQEALQYRNLARKIKTAINNKYFNQEKGIYGSGVQTEQCMALYWKIVPEEHRRTVADNLAKRVMADGVHLDVGVLGAKAILSALSDNGHPELAYQLATRDTYPSWGWWIVNGATTLYENWDLNATKDISLNHMMFGEIGAWFYKGIAGIKPDESAPGFKNILLQPNFVSGLDSFTASHDSPYGTISSGWKRNQQEITYNVIIPANTTGQLTMPGTHSIVSINRKPVTPSGNIKLTAGEYILRIIVNTPSL